MYYSEQYQTLWHDTDPWGIVRPSAVLRYMQETGNRQCRKYGYDLSDMFHNDRRGFILARLRMRNAVSLHAYETIEVRTWCPPSRGVTFMRCFSIMREGITVAEAVSYWAMVRADTKTFVRVTDFTRPFPSGDVLPEESVPEIARISPEAATSLVPVGTRPVTITDTDFNMHMNNTRYPDIVCDSIPLEVLSCKRVRDISISYAKEAPLGETLSVLRTSGSASDEFYAVRGLRANGDVCFDANVKLENR